MRPFASIMDPSATFIQSELPDCNIQYYPYFLNLEMSDQLYTVFAHSTEWDQEQIIIYGVRNNLPRLTAWYGDEGKTYSYSGIHVNAKPWLPEMLELKEQIEDVTKASYNSVLLNYYRTGQDSVAWHADDELELGPTPNIASISLGGKRTFQFKHKKSFDLKSSIELTHGSLLVMSDQTQQFWQHQIPKTKKEVIPRVNLTFRSIIK